MDHNKLVVLFFAAWLYGVLAGWLIHTAFVSPDKD